MNVEVETPVEVTDPDVIETPVETVAEADDPAEPLTEEDQDEEIDE